MQNVPKIIPFLLVLIVSVYSIEGRAACQWIVHGELQGISNNEENEQTTWPIANQAVRVQARWSSGSWWNTVNWPQSTTSAQGEFTIRSTNLLPADCKKKRDFRLQLRTGSWGEWQTHFEQSFLGPITGNGDHHVYLGIDCGNDCDGQVISLHDVFQTTVVRTDEETDSSQSDSEQRLALEYDECVARRSMNMVYAVDLTFIPLPVSDWLTTEDGLLQLKRRTAGESLTHNKLTLKVNVKNNSNANFKASRKCTADIHFLHNEGPGARLNRNNDDPWYLWDRTIDDLPSGAAGVISRNTNLYGSGNVLVGGWNESYEYTLLKVKIDPKNHIEETNKDNNRIEYCYYIPEHQFVDMENCRSN